MPRYSSCALVLCCAAMTAWADPKEDCPEGERHVRAAVRHIESGGIGYQDGYTTGEIFFSVDPAKWAVSPFLDVRGHVFDDGKLAANVGVGMRAIWGTRVYGINSYYDYRNTHRFHSNQIGVGLETLGKIFDFRINGYLPLGPKISKPYDPIFGKFSGHYLYVSQKYQSAMKGANAEFGFHFGKSKLFDFYAAAGPYYFIGDIAPATWGGKARISGTFKEMLTLEISDSYDNTFRNKFQGQISFNLALGPKSAVKKQGRTCKVAKILNARMMQPVDRQEIIVIDEPRKNSIAIDPATGLPYFFVFVDNTSSSDGTYESPYHSFTQAQNNSSPRDVLYVFPGDGTTTGMNQGISLQENQKFWGSGVSHLIQTTQGMVSIPEQSNSSPSIENSDVTTDGNAIDLASNNAISGFNIISANVNAISGTDVQSLDVSSCTFEQHIITYPIVAYFSDDALISITDNQFLNNTNGIFLSLEGTSTIVCSGNTFQGQTSESSIPIEISAENNVLTAFIENNTFDGNTVGSIRFDLNSVLDAGINVMNNTMTNNGTGSADVLGSSVAIVTSGTTNNCSIVVQDNTFSDNSATPDHPAISIYLHTSGAFTNLALTVSGNTMSNNGNSGIVLATPVETLTLLATDNIITNCDNNGIAVIPDSGVTITGTITINNNTITDIGNTANGIAVGKTGLSFSNLNLTILNNEINGCDGSGILCFSDEFATMAVEISGNVINNCQNNGANASSGISLDQYQNLSGSITNNTLLDDVDPSVAIGVFSSIASPTVCLYLSGNNNDTEYNLDNSQLGGVFNLAPSDVNTANTGTINLFGPITIVESCP